MNGLNSEDFPKHFSVSKSIAKSADDREEQSFQFSIWVLLSIQYLKKAKGVQIIVS